jgi:hypothetical protein
VRALAAEGQGDPVGWRVVFGDHGAGVEKIGDEALIDDTQRNDPGRCREGVGGRALFAERHLEGGIAGAPHGRRPRLERIERADHMGQRLPIDRYRLGGVFSLLDGVGDDECDGIADVADHVARQHRIGRGVDLHAFGDGDAGQPAQFDEVGRGEHEMDAGQAARHRDIGDAKTRMGMGRAHHHRMQRADRRNVGDIAATAPDERIVFLAGDALRDAEFGRMHGHSSRTGLTATGRTQNAP